MKTTTTTIGLFVIATFTARFAAANEEVYRSTIRSTACILTSNATGTGVLVDKERKLVVTNYHVVKDHYHVSVVFPQMEEGFPRAEKSFYLKNRKNLISATLVLSDPGRDLAVLKIDRVPENAVAIEFAEKGARPGQTIHSIGNPSISDALWVYTYGTVRQVYRKKLKLSPGFTVTARIVETQSPINPGDSGGPIVNNKGELVAISQAFQPKGRLISYGIDVQEVRSVLKGENSSVDKKVQQLIDSLRVPFTVATNGDVKFQLKLANGNRQMVYVSSKIKRQGSKELRDVQAPVRVFTRTVPESFKAMVEFANCDSDVGSWEFSKVGRKEYLIFRVRTSGLSSLQELKDTLADIKQRIETMDEMIASFNEAKTWTVSK